MLVAGLWFGRRWALVVAALAGAVIAVDALISDDRDLPMVGRAARPARRSRRTWSRRLAERARVADAELQQIRPLQDVLAPRKPPPLPLLELSSRYIPAQAGVSGDFYQVAEGRNGAAILVIGDVVGKGHVGGAAVDVRARDGHRVRALPRRPGGASCRTVNTELVHQHGVSAQFITMLCVVVKPDGTVAVGVGGPPAARLPGRRASRSGELRTGHPLGIAPEIARPRDQPLRRCPPRASCSTRTGSPTRGRRAAASSRSARPRIGAVPRASSTTRRRSRRWSTSPVRPSAFAGGSLPDDLCLLAVRSRFENRWYGAAGEPAAASAPR